MSPRLVLRWFVWTCACMLAFGMGPGVIRLLQARPVGATVTTVEPAPIGIPAFYSSSMGPHERALGFDGSVWPYITDASPALVQQVSIGLPFRALSGSRLIVFGSRSEAEAAWTAAILSRRATLVGFAPSTVDLAAAVSNFSLFGLLTGSCMFAVARGRQAAIARRVRQGACPRCGHRLLVGQPACPECGLSPPAKEKPA